MGTDLSQINEGLQDRTLAAVIEAPPEGKTLSGYAVRWNEWTQIGNVHMERFAPGSFGDSSPKVIHEHGMDPAFGMKPIASLRSLTDDGIGAAYEAELLEASYVEPLLAGLRAGLYGASFRFRALDQTIDRRPAKSDYNPQGLPEVTVTRAQIVEISTTTFPAYAGSTAAVRSTEINPQPTKAAQSHKEGKMQTIEDLLAELRGHRSRLSEIDTEYAGRSMAPEAKAEFDEVTGLITDKTELVEELRSRTALVERLAAEPKNVENERSIPNVQRSGVARNDDIYDLTSVRSSAFDASIANREIQDRALRSIEGASFEAFGDADVIRSGIEQLVRETPEVARHILTTGSPQYRSAFRKTIMGQPLDGDEIRAMSLTGANGGFATLPYQLDPSIIKTGALAINPYRAIARTVQISGTNVWKGVSSGAVVASFDAEGSEVSDDSPTYAQPSITCYPARAFVPFSFEVGEDYPNILSDLGMLIAEAKDTLEANKFTVGTGTAEPYGIVTRATTTVTAGGTGAFAVADLYALDNAVPARYQANASIVGNRAIINRIRQFDTTNGNTLFGANAALNQGMGPDALMRATVLGYPTYQISDMAAVLTTGSKILIEGDFRQFVIVDRIGMSVEVVPNLFGAAGRPTGQRGLLAHWRVGSDVTNAAAFRTLVTG